MSSSTVIEQRVCSKGIQCRHKGLPISIDCFRKGNTPPNFYSFYKTCNDCRSTSAYGLTPPSTCRSLPQQRVEPVSPTLSHHHLKYYPSPLINNRPRRETISLPARY